MFTDGITKETAFQFNEYDIMKYTQRITNHLDDLRSQLDQTYDVLKSFQNKVINLDSDQLHSAYINAQKILTGFIVNYESIEEIT